jgi:hypothetical protein
VEGGGRKLEAFTLSRNLCDQVPDSPPTSKPTAFAIVSRKTPLFPFMSPNKKTTTNKHVNGVIKAVDPKLRGKNITFPVSSPIFNPRLHRFAKGLVMCHENPRIVGPFELINLTWSKSSSQDCHQKVEPNQQNQNRRELLGQSR